MRIFPVPNRFASKMAYAKGVVILIIFCSEILHVAADVIAFSPKGKITEKFLSQPAQFGPTIKPTGMEGLLVIADPIDACGPIANAPFSPSNETVQYPFFALIKRGGCDFDKKVYNAQLAKFMGAIVYNNLDNSLVSMSGNTVAIQVLIASVFVGLDSGITLQGMNYTTGYMLRVFG